ncbi:MAG: translation initiation factor 2, partial [Paracoccaceae bacterium]|nr:translation initiation factor 2 [Paracoccaceae bacterium]
MKPNFALNLTDDSIGLLHRTSRGWMAVGEAPIDSPDLNEALGYLRASALGLSPHGITTKLILPASQILYTEIDAPGPDRASREAQIRSALDGRTPYAVDDLVFDWWGKGPTVQVAVVARETLQEAEAFAEQHRLNPVSFVTIPEPGRFGAEPWFGQTRLAAKLLPAGEKVTRDQDPVTVITRDPAAESKQAT